MRITKIVPLVLLVPFISAGGAISGSASSHEYQLSAQQKTAMAQFAYAAIDGKDTQPSPDFGGISTDYYRLYLTLLSSGKVKCSETSYSLKRGSDRISTEIQETLKKCIASGGTQEITNIVFDFLYNQYELKGNTLEELSDETMWGVDALRIEANGRSANLLSSVSVINNYSHQQTLEALCTSAGLEKDCYSNQSVKIYKLSDSAILATRDGKITDLYRSNVLLQADSITQSDILTSIAGGYSWFGKNTRNDGLLEYLYYPSADEYAKDDNDIRRLAATWGQTELMNFLGRDDARDSVAATLDHYLQYQKEGGGGIYLDIGGSANIANNAFMIMALINTPDYANRDELLRQLAAAIINAQQKDGSYQTDIIAGGQSGIDYYPGEAMLALMKLYGMTKDRQYLDSVEKAFFYYRDYWRNNQNTAFVPWHSQAYRMLYDAKPNRELTDFVFEMNDWLISKQQTTGSYPDYLGGFGEKPSNSTASYLEGLGDAYALAKTVDDNNHSDQYQKAIKLAARYVMQTQFTSDNAFYLSNPQKAIGGFRQSVVNNQERNDYTQHATLALMKVYSENIFK